ncbi:MAG: formate dehydrogenase accessory sulfurtransferase FdhD [Bacillota bacterium]
MSLPPVFSERQIITCTGGGLIEETAAVVNEIPLTVFLNDLELVTLVCSPTAYMELAMGFLMSEGLITSYAEIERVNYREDEGLLCWV